MRYLLIFLFFFIVTCASCSKPAKHIEADSMETVEVASIPQDEAFEDFIVRFHHDSVFQSSRLAKVITGYNSDEDPIYNSGIAPGISESFDEETGQKTIEYNGQVIIRIDSTDTITTEFMDSIYTYYENLNDIAEYTWIDSALVSALEWVDYMVDSSEYETTISHKSETEVTEDVFLSGSGFSFSLTFIKNDNKWILERIFYSNF